MEKGKEVPAKVPMKKEIAKKTAEFEKRLSSSKNDYETVVILCEMKEAIESEVFSWQVMIDKENNNPSAGSENVINEAVAQISSFDSLLLKIESMISQLLGNALKIEKVLLREGKISKSVLND